MSDTAPDRIRGWLIERVGFYAELPADRIDTATPLADYGIDSVYAFALCGEIEDTWRIPVDSALLWDVNTVEALTEHLSARI